MDPDPDPTFQCDADPDPTFQCDTDPEPDTTNEPLRLSLFHFDADPDPYFHFDPDRIQLSSLMLIQVPKMMRIRIRNTGYKIGYQTYLSIRFLVS